MSSNGLEALRVLMINTSTFNSVAFCITNQNWYDVWTKNIKSHQDNKVHGANMGSTWGRQDPGGPHVGPMNLAIRAGNPTYLWTASDQYIFMEDNAVNRE